MEIAPWGVCYMHMNSFNLEHMVILGHSKLAHNGSKTARRRINWTKIWRLGNICSSHMGTI